MKFYLSSAQDSEPYDDLKDNRLMQNYLREIKGVAGVEVTFEKGTAVYEGCQHIVVDIPSMKALAQIMKAIDKDLVIQQQDIPSMKALAHIMKATGKDLVIEQQYDRNNKYATIKIYDDYIE